MRNDNDDTPTTRNESVRDLVLKRQVDAAERNLFQSMLTIEMTALLNFGTDGYDQIGASLQKSRCKIGRSFEEIRALLKIEGCVNLGGIDG